METGEHIPTSKGLFIWLRPVRPDDAGHLVDIFEHMGVESRYYRFNQPLANPDPALVQRTAIEMAQVAPPVGEAWLAFAEVPGEGLSPIGGARYVRTTPNGAVASTSDSAEVSVAVRDDFQQQGAGTVLLEKTLRAAKEAGIRYARGVLRHDNLPVRDLVKKLPWKVSWEHDGPYATVSIDLEQLRSD